MPNFIATLLRVESVTRPKASYDAQGNVTVEEVSFGSNPEYATVSIEAKSLKDAREQAEAILAGDLHGLGWTSYRDTELWGKELRKLVDVVKEEDHVKRSGKGNSGGTESQAEREARFRGA